MIKRLVVSQKDKRGGGKIWVPRGSLGISRKCVTHVRGFLDLIAGSQWNMDVICVILLNN